MRCKFPEAAIPDLENLRDSFQAFAAQKMNWEDAEKNDLYSDQTGLCFPSTPRFIPVSNTPPGSFQTRCKIRLPPRCHLSATPKSELFFGEPNCY